ncbi:MAG TPA: HEAT repeat domain-containing protein [Spirochaetales bacterium]|nr:HEAT repeat domain-containing protein [Spirochaetales bacterium]
MKHSIVLLFAVLVAASPALAQSTGSERTVEESYLQQSLETMIIREQAYGESKDSKLVALQYIREAVEGGRTGPDIQAALEFLATESTYTIIRSGGYGRPTNNYPDVRREAAFLLGKFKTPEAKDTLLKVALADTEPMVIAAAIRSLGEIGIIENDDVTQAISFIVNRFDILMPDNSLAFEAIIAFELLAEANKGIADPAAIRAIMRIAEGNYIKPVQDRAKALLTKLRQYAAAGK